MVRLILLIIFIFFVVWILKPLLKPKGSSKNKDTIDRDLGSDQKNLRQPHNLIILLTGVILLGMFVWLLSKFGINLPAFIQKIIPIVSSLRGFFPF